MKISFLTITVLFCGSISLVGAQQGKLLFHHLRYEDGLSELTNQYVYKDSRGFVWISSTSGLNRYDGSRIKVYLPEPEDSTSLYGENIQSNFFEDKSSGIWFCTYDGINYYDPKHDNFSHYYISDQDHQPVPGYHIFHQDSASNLWLIVEYKGIYTFNTVNKSFRFVAPMRLIGNRAVFVRNSSDGSAKIFLYEYDSEGIEEINIDTDYQVKKDTIIKYENNGNTLKPIRIVNDGDTILWIAGKDEFIRYQIEKRSFEHIDIQGILTIENMNDSLLLISIAEKGVWVYNKLTLDLSVSYTHESRNPYSLLNNRIHFLSKTGDGGIWMSSSDVGISFSYPQKRKFSSLLPVSKTDAITREFNPTGFHEDTPDRIICATSTGGIYMLNKKGRMLDEWLYDNRKKNKIVFGIFKTFMDSRKNIWLCTFEGLKMIPSGTSEIVHLTGPDKMMWEGVELDNGRLIFSARTKWLYEAISTNGTYELIKLDTVKFPHEYIFIRQDSKGTIWICEKLQKLILVDPASFTKIAEVPVKGVTTHLIEKIPDGTVWVSSSTGLYEIDTRDYSIKDVHNALEFGCAGFNNMLEDNDGRMWLSCNNRIAVFDPSSNKFQFFNESDGMPDTQFRQYGSQRLTDGEMWFGHPGGIIRFHPDGIKNIDINAIPQITALFINDIEAKNKIICERTEATHITEAEQLTFSFRDNTLAFIINSLEYSAPRYNTVQYLMEGVDKDWLEVNSGSLVRYPGLPAGKYTLMVKAANSDGIYSPHVRKLDITITPPFYKTWWFISLTVLALIALIFYIVYLNFSKKLELQKVRLGLYENLHDDVGSRLTAIVLSAEDILHHDKTSNPKLERISNIAKSIVGNMRRLVWAIDPDNDSMSSLLTRIRHDKSLILDEKINFHLTNTPNLNQMNVPGEIRYQLTSIINEALNNISKYARANNVWIELSATNKHINLVIRDDGVGFNIDETKNDKVKASGYGLGNMKKRVARVNGSIEIQSAQGKGTRIDVKVPNA